MAETIGHGVRPHNPEFEKVVGERLGTAGLGMFFLWLGYAFLMDVGEGIALLGIGVIILGAQAARLAYGLRLEGFWAAVGSMFLLGGVGTIYELDLPLFAIVLIVAGVAVLWSLFTSSSDKPLEKTGSDADSDQQ